MVLVIYISRPENIAKHAAEHYRRSLQPRLYAKQARSIRLTAHRVEDVLLGKGIFICMPVQPDRFDPEYPADLTAVVVVGRSRCGPDESSRFLGFSDSKGAIDAVLCGNRVDRGRIVSARLGRDDVQSVTPVGISNVSKDFGISTANIAQIGGKIGKFGRALFVDLFYVRFRYF